MDEQTRTQANFEIRCIKEVEEARRMKTEQSLGIVRRKAVNDDVDNDDVDQSADSLVIPPRLLIHFFVKIHSLKLRLFSPLNCLVFNNEERLSLREQEIPTGRSLSLQTQAQLGGDAPRERQGRIREILSSGEQTRARWCAILPGAYRTCRFHEVAHGFNDN